MIRPDRSALTAMLLTAVLVAGCGSSAGTPTAPASSQSGIGAGATSVATAGPTLAPTNSATAIATAGPTSAPSGPATATASPVTTATPAGACQPPPVPAPAVVIPTGDAPAIALRPVATGLHSPVGIVAPPDESGRLFIVEQGGAIRVVAAGALRDQPFLDVSDLTASGGERGLLGLAFHPGYACNGRFFINYTDLAGDTIIAEYRASAGDPEQADPTAIAILLTIDQPFPNHNGGDVVFGPDGMLYVGMGDGGSGGDPQGNGQRVDTLLGKLLRLDVDHPAAGKAYAAPPTNCSGCPNGALPEIFARGLRNPWRFTFDRATGDIWIGDVGQNRYEEVDHLSLSEANGANFGWNQTEGRHCYPSGSTCDRTGLKLPVAEYDHSGGACSITGGFVSRGTQVPGVAGSYVYADYCAGTVRAIAAGGPNAGSDPVVMLESGLNISSFGEGRDGELYVADVGSGRILQLVAAQ